MNHGVFEGLFWAAFFMSYVSCNAWQIQFDLLSSLIFLTYFFHTLDPIWSKEGKKIKISSWFQFSKEKWDFSSVLSYNRLFFIHFGKLILIFLGKEYFFRFFFDWIYNIKILKKNIFLCFKKKSFTNLFLNMDWLSTFFKKESHVSKFILTIFFFVKKVTNCWHQLLFLSYDERSLICKKSHFRLTAA